MKETVKINLGQRLFDLDIDAYQALKKYLDSLKRYFQKSPDETDEILQDIEQRMADILEEKSGKTKQVVTLEDITNIISMMGTAEDFASEAESMEENTPPINDDKEAISGSYSKGCRHLYRDIENNILGGVCGGIAVYFNIDPVWVRLVWVLLFFLKGIGLLAYLIMWIVVPAARTTAQKLEMSGRLVNIENIEQAVKKEFRKVKENLDNFQESGTYRRTQNAFAEMFSILGHIILVFLKVGLVLAGVILAFIGIGLIVGLVTISSFGIHHLYIPQIPFLYYLQPYLQSSVFFILALSIVILVPVFGIFTGLIRFIFNIRASHHILSGFAWIIWILALVFVIFTFASEGKMIYNKYKTKDEIKLNVNREKILYISFAEENRSKNNVDLFNFFGKEIVHNQNEKKYYLHPNIQIEPSNDSDFYLKVERTQSIPVSEKDEDMHNSSYIWTIKDSVLILNTYYNVDEKKIWQIPGMKLTILVPEGKRININQEGRALLRREKNTLKKYPAEYFDKVVIMKNGDLQAIDKTGN